MVGEGEKTEFVQPCIFYQCVSEFQQFCFIKSEIMLKLNDQIKKVRPLSLKNKNTKERESEVIVSSYNLQFIGNVQ